ncbi:NB-ARC domain-containing protein [Streptomyces sp. NPDC004647]|uniref:NB-ARC domain-containing protein n=1 Tax=Streptomyces sp. NPDC004647 TaxID=3154671 RepID=UPI0033B3B1CA
MAVSAVQGLGGVGKTALAIHVAHTVCGHFPDGQLYVNLLGQSPRPVEPEAVLNVFLRSLGVPDPAIPEGWEERAALYRSTLADRRVLILLDNAHNAAQVRPLLPGAPGCAVLITSRTRFADLDGASLIDLDVMSRDEALALLAHIIGEDRAQCEPEASCELVAACGYLPLAVRIAASRLATRPAWTVSTLAARLADERRRLHELKAGDRAVDTSFALGYRQLSPDQARAFRLLALPDGPDLSLAAAAAVLDRPHEDLASEALLESLVDVSLLESAGPGRYRYHDLLRLYARHRAAAEDTDGEREAALSRLLDFYLATACHTHMLENPGHRLSKHMAVTTRAGLLFDHGQPARDWLFSEGPCIHATVQQAASHPNLVHKATDVLFAVQALMESGAYARQYESATRRVADSAQHLKDLRSEGGHAFFSGWCTTCTAARRKQL